MSSIYTRFSAGTLQPTNNHTHVSTADIRLLHDILDDAQVYEYLTEFISLFISAT